MNTTRRHRLVAALVVAPLIIAACGSDRSSDDEGSSPSSTEGTDTSTPDSETAMFGDLEWPCGPGDASAATQQGVTAESIVIGVGDDRGAAQAPGLNKPQTDAVEAMAAMCNELGGINGRMVETKVYDAALFDAAAKMTEACGEVFMMVGHGFALDDAAEEVRVGCGLASVPGFTASSVAAHGPDMLQSVPNPADQINVGQGVQLAELFPDEIGNAAAVFANFAATQQVAEKTIAGFETVGWDFTTEIEYNVVGEEDWTPFALQLKDAGAEIVFFAGSCPNFIQLVQASSVNDYEPIWFAAPNFYDQEACADANTDGLLDDVYPFVSYGLIEEGDANPAVGDFIEIASDAGATPSLLGMQGTASFLLWATGAAACGDELTSDCVLDEISGIEGWTAGGLHGPTTPRENNAGRCSILIKFEGTEYVRVAPEGEGELQCDDSWNVTVGGSAVEQAQLNDERISTRYIGS